MSPQPRKREPEGTASIPELPTTPCTHLEFAELRQDIHDIKYAVIGDEKLGQRGLISRMATAERVLLVLAAVAIILGGEKVIKLLFA